MDKVVLGGIFLGGPIPIPTKTHDFLFFHKDGFDLNFKVPFSSKNFSTISKI